jgi:hypothetical protein
MSLLLFYTIELVHRVGFASNFQEARVPLSITAAHDVFEAEGTSRWFHPNPA